MRAFAALGLLLSLGLSGCGAPTAPAVPVLKPEASFLLPATGETGPVVEAAPSDEVLALQHQVGSGKAVNGANRPVVRLHGVVSIAESLAAHSANAKGNRVVGTFVRAEEVGSGRVLKRAFVFYDGSFELDLEVRPGLTPIVLAVDVVSAEDAQQKVTLYLPLGVNPVISEVSGLEIGAGSTTLYRLYQRMVAEKMSEHSLAQHVGTTSLDVVRAFGLVARQDAAITQATRVQELDTAMSSYIDRVQLAR